MSEDSYSSVSGDSQSSEGREAGQPSTARVAVRGGAGGVASLIRASKQNAGGLGALDKLSREARMQRCLSTQEGSQYDNRPGTYVVCG